MAALADGRFGWEKNQRAANGGGHCRGGGDSSQLGAHTDTHRDAQLGCEGHVNRHDDEGLEKFNPNER